GNQLLTHPVFSFHGASATTGFQYDFSHDLKLLFNYSLASRIPNPSELFSEGLHHSASRIEVGDLRFEKETAHKFSLTFKKQTDKFSFSISPYLNLVQGFIFLEPVGIRQTIRGSFQLWEYQQSKARLLGLDVDASVKLTDHF